jgi:ribosomal protein S18 acetylase RimI-like enzyme
MDDYEIVDVTPENLDRYDLFCQKSKARENGYQRKVAWFKERYKEGLRIKLLLADEGKEEPVSRGFVEYVPAERGWRGVKAPGYFLIHCIWVVGRHKRKGCGSRLLRTCVRDARKAGAKGVAVVASKGNWLPCPGFFARHGFEAVATSPPAFALMAKKFGRAPDPSFLTGWDEKLARCGEGLTIMRAAQCPYAEDGANHVAAAAAELGIPTTVVELASAGDVRGRAVTPYGVFNVVYDGGVFSYYYLLKKEALERFKNRGA